MEVVGNGIEMDREGERLFKKFGERRSTIKVPCTPDGLYACRVLSKNLIKVNVTLIFSAAQGIILAAVWCNLRLSFCRGRLDDNSIAGLEVVRSISEIFRIHGIRTQVLSASIRTVQRAVRSWYNGAEVVTMPPKVFEDMYNHVLTDKGLEIFDNDWKVRPISMIKKLSSTWMAV